MEFVLIGGLLLAVGYFAYALGAFSEPDHKKAPAIKPKARRKRAEQTPRKKAAEEVMQDDDYLVLINQVAGDHDRAERLIKYEMRNNPAMNRSEAIKEASFRIIRF
ncbi:MAG: hypothetical protein ABFS39_18885 [Pseudomonadota bacterium]